MRRTNAQVRRLTQLYAALSQCNQAMVRCKREEDLLPQICHAAVEFGGMKMAWIGFVDHETRMVLPTACFGHGAEEYLQGIEISVDADSPLGNGPTGTAIRKSHPVWYHDSKHKQDHSPWHERRARFGWVASAALPLYREGAVVGALNLYAGEADAFDESARNLLTEIATDISFALDNFAREFQRKQAETALRASEERYRALTALSSDAYWELDANLRFIRFSSPSLQQQGADLGAFLRKTRHELTEMGWDKPRLAALDAILAARQPFRDFEISHRYRDGPERYVQLSGEPTLDGSGRFTGYRGVSKDITERRKGEADLHCFRAAMDATADGVYLVDRASMHFIDVNAAACAMLGLTREEILKLGPEGVLSTPREELARIYDAVISGSATEPIELLRRRRNGTQAWVEIRRRAQQLGESWVIVTVARDITERKRGEAQLRLAARVFDHTQEAIVITDADANILSVNRRFTEITGYRTDEVLGRNPRILSSGRQDREFYRAMWATIHAQGYWSGEIWNRHKDGHVFAEWLSISAVRDDRGEVINYIAVFVDISQRIAMEAALRASEEKFAKAFHSSPMFVAIGTLVEGRFIDVNEGFLDGTGHSPEEVIGSTSLDIGLWKTPGERQCAVDAMLENGRLSRFEAELCKKSGESMICEIWAEPIEIEAEQCIIWVANDVTQHKKAEMEICQLNAELEQRVAARTKALEQANAELEAFSYTVSHDLRAPLRAIHGFSRLLDEQYAGQIDEQGRDMLRRVGAGTRKMGQLIDDLLKLSRISRQAMHVEPLDLSVLAWEVIGDLQADTPERRVAWVIAPQAPAVGDPGLLRVVLQNLIGNAWKYSSRRDDARIEFGVDDKDGRTVYFVRDNGAGFDMAHAKNLFRAFQRLHSAAEFPGSGIGLATVARIVQRHGGDAWGEGRVGEGASFYFVL